MKLDNVIQPGKGRLSIPRSIVRSAKCPSATHMPTSFGWVKGFSPDAEIEGYNSLYDKVMADEKKRRLSKGLPAEEPGFWGKMKTKVQGNNDAKRGTVKDASDNASRDDI